jgi:hypothetical protein
VIGKYKAHAQCRPFKTMFIISKCNYVVANANKVTIANVQQWINIHIFLMKNWQHVPILLTFKKLEVGATLNNIKTMILDAMGTYMVFLMMTWPPNGFALDVMVIQCCKVFGLASLHKFESRLPRTYLVCIVSHIEPP